MRDLLRLRADQCWFADKSEKYGLKKARTAWKGIHTHLGDVRELFGRIPKAAIVNLDFCGLLSVEREEIVQEVAPHVMDWGMVFYTFFRGREMKGRYGYEVLKKSNAKTLDGKRLQATASLLLERLGKGFLPVFALRYTSLRRWPYRVGPMAILGFQKVPEGFERNSHWLKMLSKPAPYDSFVPMDDKTLHQQLRLEVQALHHKGFDTEQIAAILSMSRVVVDAWLPQPRNSALAA